MERVILDGRALTPADLHRIAGGASALLGDRAREHMGNTLPFDRPVIRDKWAWLVGGEPPADEHALIQRFLVGHCATVGEPLPDNLVRAIIAARANVLAKGYSAVRPCVVDSLLALLDHDILPIVPRLGSVGAAGCPALAAIAVVVCHMGGRVRHGGVEVPASQVIARLTRLRPTQKEALSLINGSTLTTALAAIAVARARRVLDTAITAAAMSFEVVRADLGCLDGAALSARGHRGGSAVAERLRAALAGSSLVSHGRQPDPFSIRCTPAVLGAALDALDHVEDIVATELNAAIDNPLVTPDHRVVEAGNFHAAPVALALDHLKVAMTHVASIADRRIFRMTYGQLSGLPSYLANATGLNSGLMLAQYTAASRLSEAKGLAHPASVDSIPTIQHREDHVAMGPGAAFAALEILEAVADVVAIELMCAAQGIDLHRDRLHGVSLGHGTQAAHATVRAHIHHWHDDRTLHPDLVAIGDRVRAGTFVRGGPAW